MWLRKVILLEFSVATLAIIGVKNRDWDFINEFIRFFVVPNLPYPSLLKRGEFFAKHKDGRFIFTVINIKYANDCDE